MGAEVLILEGAKLILGAYFDYMRLNGKTEAEIKAVLTAEIAKFDANDPFKLADVPDN